MQINFMEKVHSKITEKERKNLLNLNSQFEKLLMRFCSHEWEFLF